MIYQENYKYLNYLFQLRDKKTADEMYLLSIEVDRLKSENLEFSHRSNEFEMLR